MGIAVNSKSDVEKYYTTTQAAKILGISIATVQRMVEKGLVKAFVTEGGHRRIWASSLSSYAQERGGADTQEHMQGLEVCVLHSNLHITEELVKIHNMPHVNVITNPLDLMGQSKQVAAFFVDTRIAWLENSPIDFQAHAYKNAHIIAYGGAGLSKTSAWRKKTDVTLLEEDINADFVRGYMLAAGHKIKGTPAKPKPEV